MKHWIFDLDGTLVDSFQHYFEALDELFREHDQVFHPELRHPALTHSLPLFFEEHLGKNAVETALSKLQMKSNEDALKIKPFPGVIEALRHLARQDSKMAVWTNRDLTSAELILNQTGLSDYMDLCISGTCAPRKPDPEGLMRIAKHFDCKPELITMVGDHDHDMEAAQSAGAKSIRASWHSYWEIDPCKKSDRQFYKVTELATYF